MQPFQYDVRGAFDQRNIQTHNTLLGGEGIVEIKEQGSELRRGGRGLTRVAAEGEARFSDYNCGG